MKNTFFTYLLLLGLVSAGCNSDEPEKGPGYVPVKVTKTNPMKLYMHYMPWFHAPSISGYWGSHWRMANNNPQTILGNGQRDIAAHYYPLIGPYDSADPDVIEYHLLLMKYAGIDGVLIDWYGTHKVLDYHSNLENANALISRLDTIGLEFGIVYEEFTTENVANRKGITAIEAAQNDLLYMEEEYFSSSQYIQVNEKPLLLTFGPRYFKTEDEWTEILNIAQEKPTFLPLWNHSHRVGESNASGEFSWVDFDYSQPELSHFYNGPSPSLKIGSAFPGFHDYYEEGGWGQSYGYVSHLGGETFQKGLDLAQSNSLSYLQLVTWNDFGEGTMIEPTVEFQFLFLEKIQEFSGVAYGVEELELVYQYYQKRKESDNAEFQRKLDDVFQALNELEPTKANQLLNDL